MKDRYRVDEEIGRGGMATVFRAQDLKYDRPVATPQQSVILEGATNTQTACLQHSQLYTDATVYQQVRNWVS